MKDYNQMPKEEILKLLSCEKDSKKRKEMKHVLWMRYPLSERIRFRVEDFCHSILRLFPFYQRMREAEVKDWAEILKLYQGRR